MSDSFGRSLDNEVKQELKDLLFPKKPFCWVCGAELRTGENTLCRLRHRNSMPFDRLPPRCPVERTNLR